MIKILMLIVGSFLLSPAYAVDCNKHPIYCKIKSLKPKMSYKRAMHLSNLMYKFARKHKVKNILRSVAIAMQETTLRNINRRQTVIVFYFENGIEKFKYVKGSSDIGTFQFHADTIRLYNMDAVKLKNNLAYSVDQHFMLMKKKLKYCKHLGADAWTCYHSRTAKFRKRYKEDVERYY
jgi:hypothetical protein